MYVASNVGLRYILNGACLHFSPPFGISQCLMTFNEMSVNPHYGGTPTRSFGLGLVRGFFCARAPRRQQPHRAGAAWLTPDYKHPFHLWLSPAGAKRIKNRSPLGPQRAIWTGLILQQRLKAARHLGANMIFSTQKWRLYRMFKSYCITFMRQPKVLQSLATSRLDIAKSTFTAASLTYRRKTEWAGVCKKC